MAYGVWRIAYGVWALFIVSATCPFGMAPDPDLSGYNSPTIPSTMTMSRRVEEGRI